MFIPNHKNSLENKPLTTIVKESLTILGISEASRGFNRSFKGTQRIFRLGTYGWLFDSMWYGTVNVRISSDNFPSDVA